jgi:protein disulfide-isomerase A6
MVNHKLALAASAFLAALPIQAQGLYSQTSPVLRISGNTYDNLIAQSNYTSIVEFYAPWCGHCKSLQPAYEKVAKSLAGLAKVAAINCDDEKNKPFCSTMGVTGFPTLKIVRPSKIPGKPTVEDYAGPRTVKGIADAVAEKIPNLVRRVNDNSFQKWLGENDQPKVILFSDKGKTSALLKAVALEFKDAVSVAQIRNTDNEEATLELFNIKEFPTLVVLPGGSSGEGILYNGELAKSDMVNFISSKTNINPHPDPAPLKKNAKASKSNSKKGSTEKSKEKEFSSSSASQASEEGKTGAATATDETLSDEATPSPEPIVEAQKPILLPPAPPIPVLSSESELGATACLGPKSGTCVFALLPASPDEVAAKAIGSLSEIAHRHRQAKRNLFPFFALPEQNKVYARIQHVLKLKGTEIVAVNGKRNWWRKMPAKSEDGKYEESEVTEEAIERWIDSIRMGEGEKLNIPVGLIEVPQEELAQAIREGKIRAEDLGKAPPKQKGDAPKVVFEGEGFVVEEFDEAFEEANKPERDVEEITQEQAEKIAKGGSSVPVPEATPEATPETETAEEVKEPHDEL